MTTNVRQLYFEAVKVGDELPPLVKPPVDRLQIARYVGAAGDWNPLYIDEPHARAAGYPSAFAPGTIGLGFVAELTTDWTRGARLRKLQSRFVKLVWPGDVLSARGRVVDRRFEPNGVYTIDIEVWAENQRGELVTRGLATYQLYYSAEDEGRQRAGQPPLLVTPAEEEARLARLSRAQPPRPAVPPRPMQPPRPIASAAPPPPPSVGKPRAPLPAAAPARAAARSAPAAKGKATKKSAGKGATRPVKKAAPKKKAPAKKAVKKAARRPAAKAARRPAKRPAKKPAKKAGKKKR